MPKASLRAIVKYCDRLLHTHEISDYAGAVNGLQVENRGSVSRIAAAVDASLATVRLAIQAKADLLIVHHGLFWSPAQPWTGKKYELLRLLIENDVAVYSSHLPLDLHAKYGNNAILAREFGLTPTGGFASSQGVQIGVNGTSDVYTSELAGRVAAFCARHHHHLVTTPLRDAQKTFRWGICSGAGASSDTIMEARSLGLDTIIVGEGPHHSAVQAADEGITVLYAGHYATETVGVRAIAEEIGKRFSIKSSFIDAPTGL
jgi:dinuclear metal center YbgI/SA1388 family protein